MNQTITLPREVAAAIAQILIDAKTGECDYQDGRVKWSIDQLAAALEQPQRKLTSQEIADSALLGNIESQFNACMHQEHCKRWKAQAGLQHQHESRHINDLATKTSHSVTTCSTVPEGWKMVPVEPTIAMLCDAVMEWEGQAVYKVMSASGLRKLEEQAADGYRSMLAAAPQPPEHYDQQALDLCLTCGWKTMIPGDRCLNCARQKPQVEQEPVATLHCTNECYVYACLTDSGKQMRFEHPLPLYTSPPALRKPLTNEQVKAGLIESIEYTDKRERCAFNIGVRFAERAHGIGQSEIPQATGEKE